MNAKAYAKYKPSGVEWLGDVPEHWEVKRLKWVGEAIIGLTYSPDDVVNEGDGTLVLRSSNIQDGKIVLNDNVFVSAEIPRRLRTRPKDIVICTRNGSRALVGKTGMISEQESGLTFGAFTAVFRSSANDYMFYVFNSGLFSFQAGLFQTSTIFQLTNGTINSFLIPLPPSSEQKSIADFLDDRTSKLDALLEKKRALIGKLKEKRSALISRTVTKGLPPEAAAQAGLTPNPKLKSSGVPWLGDIPKHWEVVSVRYAFYNLDYRRIPIAGEDRAYVEKAYPYYGASGIIDHVEDYIFDETLILVAEDGANLLSRSSPLAFLAQGKYWVNNHAHILKPVSGDIRFWVQVLATYDYSPLVSGAAQPKLTSDRLGGIRVPQPPPEEQIAIANFLDVETSQIDRMIQKVETAIEKLTEYRTALITAAVTGKIDVRKLR